MIEITIHKAGEADRRMLLKGGVYRMGRQDDNEIVLADKEVSRHHARFLVERDTCVVEDLGGGNGTWVGGTSVHRHVLKTGDEVEILPFLLKVRTHAKPEPRKVPVVRITEGNGVGTRIVLAGGVVTLGRGNDQDVRLDDQGASRAHATLTEREGQWFLRDLDSANGVYLNDQRVMEAPVDPGDLIAIGDSVLRFTIESEHEDEAAIDADALLDEEPTDADGPAPRYAARGVPVQPPPPPHYSPAPAAPPAYGAPPPSAAPPVALAPVAVAQAQGASNTLVRVLVVMVIGLAALLAAGAAAALIAL